MQPHPPSTVTRRITAGVVAAIAASIIGSAWQIASRQAVTTSLDPLSLAVLRYCIPSLLLLPIVVRTGLLPVGVSRLALLFLVVGGGLPFVLLGLTGARFAPVAHMGVLLASVMPVFTALLAKLIYKDRLTRAKILGFALIGVGVAVLGQGALRSVGASTLLGDVLFLLAALFWAAYSMAFRACKLTPWQGVALVNAWSALLVIPLYLVFGSQALFNAPVSDLLLQTWMQGVVAGVLGLYTYSAAMQRLGAAPAAAFAALVPVLSAIGGAVFLNERLTTTTMAAAGLAAAGVVLASGLVSARAKSSV